MVRAETYTRAAAAVSNATDAIAEPAAADSGASETPAPAITLRVPCAEDGARLHALVAACPPLDPNSLYCNLLQCTHFRGTSVAAERDGELVGFISGYIPPEQPDTLFVWQVAVHAIARGERLGKRMLQELLARPQCREVRYLDTTVTPGNAPSRAMFDSLARALGAEITTRVLFERERHFGGVHDSEELLRIGPFAPAAGTAATSASPPDR